MTDKIQNISLSKQAVYLVLNGSEEKQGQTNPTVLGFRNRTHLRKWLSKGGTKVLRGWVRNEGDCFGGWPTVIEVSHITAEDADSWLMENKFYARR